MDRDKKFTTKFRDLLEYAGTDVIRLLHRSPNLNAYVERFVLSIKSECLERMIFFSEQSLRRAVAEFIHHYYGERNHQGLGNALLDRSPNLNAYVERFVLSIKSECLERMIFFSEQSLRRAVAEFIHHYYGERNHQGLGNALLEAEECVGSPHGKVRCRKRLGGLLSYYHRDAA